MSQISRNNVKMETIPNDNHQGVISFEVQPECDREEWSRISRMLIGKILSGRNTIVVSKKDTLMDLLSDEVLQPQKNYVRENIINVESFVPTPESDITHHCTLVKKIPEEVVRDLANSSEFTFGNLWFLVPIKEKSSSSDLRSDVCKLTPSAFSEVPQLTHEVISSPAMYDGCTILWFNPDEEKLNNDIKPMFEQ